MSNESQIERIRNNVSDALAATAEMGASVPATANSDNLGALIRSIPKSGGTVVEPEPAVDDIPKVFFTGTAPTIKADDELPLIMDYRSKTQTIKSYVTLKVQGDSSASYPKKNFNLKMFSDEDRSEKLKVTFRDWKTTHKYCLKANWIDHTHARNVVGGRLWSQIVRSRADYSDYPSEYQDSPHCGAVDGFPIKVYLNGVYQGLYTWNIRKDDSMFNMDDGTGVHSALIADAGNSVTVWRSLPNIDGTDWTDELNDTVPDAVKNGFQNVYRFVINSTDDEFKANIHQYFYLSSLIDYYIYIYCILMIGGLAKSQTMLTYDAAKFLANIYDMDTTWALHWNGSSFYDVLTPCPSGYTAQTEVGASNLLYERIEKLYAEEIKARYEELRSSVLSDGNIINEFERFMDVIGNDLYAEDFASTTASGAFTNIPSASTNNLQKLREVIVKRMAYCDEAIPAIGNGDSDTTTPEIEWELGTVGAGGLNDANNARIRTVGYLPKNITKAVANDGYLILALLCDAHGKALYSTSGGSGYWVESTASIGLAEYAKTIDLSRIYQTTPGHNIRIIVKRTDNANMNVSESENVIFTVGNNEYAEWVNYAVNGGNGRLRDEKTRLVTVNHIDTSIKTVTAASGYKVALACFVDNAMAGYWNVTSGDYGEASYVQSIDLESIRLNKGCDFIVMVRRDDNANIDVSEASNITFA